MMMKPVNNCEYLKDSWEIYVIYRYLLFISESLHLKCLQRPRAG